MFSVRALLVFVVVLVAAASVPATAVAQAWSVQDLYREGRLRDGRALTGTRGDRPAVSGAAAACATCHKRSGLGGGEGRITVPPIIGRYLFRSHATNVQDLSLPHLPGYRATREPYTAEALARVIRTGVDPSGRQLNVLMPRYALDDATIKSLTDYLGSLAFNPEPGVTDDTLHFATVVTPDADPAAKRAMLEVMTRFFEDKNSFLRGGAKAMKASREIEYRVTRRWVLHVWELRGPAETWDAQLQAKMTAEPVFALVSGLGGLDWAPVHRFCESAKVPCLFPNVIEPIVAETDYYPVYFSRGLFLEADLILQVLRDRRATDAPVRRVVQFVMAGQPGIHAAQALEHDAAGSGWSVQTRRLESAAPGAIAAALADVTADDALVLWLPPDALAQLPATGPRAGAVFASGLLGRLEQAPLPAAWRAPTMLAYPVDPPQQRRARLALAMGWFRIRGIPLVDERIQVDTYVACGIAAEMVKEMLDSFVRDFLVERVETMLSHRLNNGYYPRLSLAPGQRFASKGGYLVHLSSRDANEVVPEGDWRVP